VYPGPGNGPGAQARQLLSAVALDRCTARAIGAQGTEQRGPCWAADSLSDLGIENAIPLQVEKRSR
jgi:hypothetical protein